MGNQVTWTTDKFFERLDFFLSSKGITMNKLCSSADISVNTLYNMKQRNSLPSLQTICILCDALNVSISDFFDLDNINQVDSAEFVFAFNNLSDESKHVLLPLMGQLK